MNMEIGFWLGKSVEKLRKKELLDVIKYISNQLDKERARYDRREEWNSAINEKKRKRFTLKLLDRLEEEIN